MTTKEAQHYWLMKTEPDTFSIDTLKEQKISMWEGVRNFTARNNLKAMRKGDLVLIHHSSIAEPHIAGIGIVATEAYPDPTQFLTSSQYFDKRATEEKPYWFAVDIQFKNKIKNPVMLAELKRNSKFKGMMVATMAGSRLSVQPVSESHFKAVEALRESGAGSLF